MASGQASSKRPSDPLFLVDSLSCSAGRAMSSSTPSSSSISSWTIAPVTLAEYANALYEVVELLRAFNSRTSVPDNSEVLSLSHRLSFLNKSLRDCDEWGLSSSNQIKSQCQAVQDFLDPIETAYTEGTPFPQMLTLLTTQLSNASFETALATALGSLSPLSEGNLDIPPEEVLFIETFRRFNNRSDRILSNLGETVNAASDLLEGLNLLNEACTWNPGPKYISPEGFLINPTLTDSWYTLFLAQADASKIKGISLLRGIDSSEVYPEESSESIYLKKILNKIDASSEEGGFGGLINESLVKKMWEDQSFQVDLRTAIELALNINERAQHDVNKILFETKAIADATASLFENQNQSLTSVARRINR
ncbi:hypothetical protein [Candidatus Similichlamydia laticola]|uniref:Uncharacterized protein n=1 Tax=Candidatus Similichlamydia laticola TaxID=2170265 RepID=A0A369KB14_9BACT|nr:hypothetical protein [Candidatus Similichlamydia laticola]RDB31799.1 hypothetical protein HAT2_00092 [Candidatus Similichlamydia laticola]